MQINPFQYSNGSFRLTNEHRFSLNSGVTAVCGPVGSGKSTFLKLLADPELRTVAVMDDYPFPAYLSQDLTRLFSGNTVRSLIELYSDLRVHGKAVFAQKRFEEICTILKFPFTRRLQDKLHDFSEGELQRFGIALATSLDSELLIYDEPLTALNAEHRRCFYHIVRLEKNKRRILIVSHSLQDIKCTANDFIFISKGNLEPPAPLNILLENTEYLQYFRS